MLEVQETCRSRGLIRSSASSRKSCLIGPQPTFAEASLKFVEAGYIDLCSQGVGGTYFVKDPLGHKHSIFKPEDEEPGSVDNPKDLMKVPLLPPGRGSIREVAAYLLDRGFAGVPETHLISPKINGVLKRGSIQRYIPNNGESGCMSSSRFRAEDIHRIGILDIRLFNMDRTAENMLVVQKGDQYRLVPIDHTYCLPEKLDNAFFEWMYWPQAKVPFSREATEFIRSIDVQSELKQLRKLGFNWKEMRTLEVTTIFLQKCLVYGFNLFEIAGMMCRDSEHESELEYLVTTTKNLCGQERGNIFSFTFRLVASNYLKHKSCCGRTLW